MPTTATEVSRLQLDHPDLGHDGGTNLHNKVRDAWTKIGDNMDSRFFTEDALADAANVSFIHNFKTAFDELRINLFERNTGTGELTRIETGGSPDLADFTIEATPGSLTTAVRITNNTGGPVDIAAVVVHGKGAEIINDLEDVDTVTNAPESGQALVWDGTNFVPGASGDASFKVQSVQTDGTTVIKGGYLIDDKGREFATYDGGGSASTDFGTDLTIDLDNIEAAPVNDTTYFLYLDDGALQAQVTQTDTGRKVYPVEEGQLVLFTDAPDSVNLARYTPLGFVRYATGAWSDTIFGTTAFRRHDDPSVVVSPVAYSLSKQSIGTVGAVTNAQGALEVADVDATTSFYSFDGDSLDKSANANEFDGSSGTDFTGKGFFGRTSLLTFDGVATFRSKSTPTDFAQTGTDDISAGGWFKFRSLGNMHLYGIYTTAGDARMWRVVMTSSGTLLRFDAQPGVFNAAQTVEITVDGAGIKTDEWIHIAYEYNGTTRLLRAFINGALVGSKTVTLAMYSATVPDFFVGRNSSGGEFFDGEIQDLYVDKVEKTAEEINGIYSKRFIGGVGQLRGGHVLVPESFPETGSSKLSFWNLDGDYTDDSGNGRDLGATGGTPDFSRTGLFGSDSALTFSGGTDFTKTSTDAFFNFNLDENIICFGAWVNMDDWYETADILKAGDFTDSTSVLFIRTTAASIHFETNSTPDFQYVHDFVQGSWHHLALKYKDNFIYAYVDGHLVGSLAGPGTHVSSVAGTFDVSGGTGFAIENGRVREAFYTKNVDLNESDFKKFVSSRIEHNKNVPLADQFWSFNHHGEDDCGPVSPVKDLVIDKKPNSVYIDLNAASDGDLIDGKLQNLGLTAQTVAVHTFDRTFTSDPDIGTTPIDTNLASDPTSIEVLKLVAGNWSVVPDGNSLIDIANTGTRAISGDLSSTDPTPTEPVRVVISTAPAALSVSNAKSGEQGIIDLKWTGYTKFVGGSHPDAYANLAAAFAAAVAGDSILVCESYSVSTSEDLTASDVKVTFMPGVVITITGNDYGMEIDGDRCEVIGARYRAELSPTLSGFFRLDGSDNEVRGLHMESNDAGLTVAFSVEFGGSSARNYLSASVKQTLGTVTAVVNDGGTDNDISIRG